MRVFISLLISLAVCICMSACQENGNIVDDSGALLHISEEVQIESAPEPVPPEREEPVSTGSSDAQTDSSSSKSPESSSVHESGSVNSETVSSQPSESSPSSDSSSAAPVSSTGEVKAIWISYLEYGYMLTGKAENTFRSNVKSYFDTLAEDGFNTVFVHARSHGDAYYRSEIFPWSKYVTGTEGKDPGFDPLKIMVEEAHSRGLKIEAWINPYRISTSGKTSSISSQNPAYSLLNTSAVKVLSDGIYYNPASEVARQLIIDGVEEIVRNYDVDGIHFDDYFYPTTAESFDSEDYKDYVSSGGKDSLAEWRRSNVSLLIKKVYSAIKNADPSCRFGVSPSGNMDNNMNIHYCDVYKWASSTGYVDYICPQIYWGYSHSSKPYLTVLNEFNSLVKNSSVDLYVGLAAYKIGTSDGGSDEWISDGDILSREITDARKQSSYGGFAIYRFDSLYNPSSDVLKKVDREYKNLLKVI